MCFSYLLCIFKHTCDDSKGLGVYSCFVPFSSPRLKLRVYGIGSPALCSHFLPRGDPSCPLDDRPAGHKRGSRSLSRVYVASLHCFYALPRAIGIVERANQHTRCHNKRTEAPMTMNKIGTRRNEMSERAEALMTRTMTDDDEEEE